MPETHKMSFDYFDLVVTVTDEGSVNVEFFEFTTDENAVRKPVLAMAWDDLREVLDFTAVHGLKMKEPYVVEFEDTREAIEA